jgi:hypothetical protein
MGRPNALVRLAWLAHAVAWVVPVHKDGVRLPEGLPGWQAFRIALSPLWPYYEGGGSWDPWYGALLSVTSGLTNIVMLASVPIALEGTPRQRAVLAWLAMLAVLVNAGWVNDKDWVDLRAGYYLWWASFVAMAFGFLRRRA